MRRLGKVYQAASVLVYLFIAAAVWLPWIESSGENYNLPGYVKMVEESGGIVAMTDGAPELVASYYLFFIPLAAAFLAGIYVAGKLAGRSFQIAYKAVRWCEFIYTVAALIFFPLVPMLWTYSIPVLCLVEYVAGQYVEQREGILRDARVREERDKREQEERRRRLYFPGRYSSYYYKMILKNVKYHIRNYVMLILSGAFLMLFLFLVFALRYAFLEVHTAEDVIGGETQKILLNAVWVGLILNAVLMGLSFSYYIRNKMREENALVLLGIRSRSLKSMMIMEYAGCLVCSGIIGIFAGNLIFHFLIKMLETKFLGMAARLPVRMYAMVFAVFVLAALVAAAVNSHIYDHMRWSASGLLAPKKNGIPGVLGWVSGALGGFGMLWALVRMSGRGGGEREDYQGLFLLGLILMLLCVQAARVKWTKREENRYYQFVFDRFPFLTGFGQNMKKIYILTVIAFLIMYTFSSNYGGNLSAPSAREQYPFDFVCMAGEDEREDFGKLKEQYSLDISRYPMTTVYALMPNNISLIDSVKDIFGLDYAAVSNGRQVLTDPPVQIGIPESVYLELKKEIHGEEAKALNLAGEEIAVVYQEDVSAKAHLLDWSQTEDTWNLQTKSPDMELWSYRAYTKRKVTGKERDILTGVYDGGEEQNLVVFSDGFFQTIYQNEELYLIHAPKENYEAAKEGLLNMSEHSESMRFYGRRAMIQDRETERYLKQVVWLFNIIMAGVCGIYLLFIKFCFEMDEIVERYRFLDCMGMHESTLKKTLRKEMLPFFVLPLLAGGISSVVFTVLMFHVRMYSKGEVLCYLQCILPVWCIYWIVQAAVYVILNKVLLKKIYSKGM